MTLLDAYALISFIVGGRAGMETRALLREGDVAIPTANLAEAIDVTARVHALPMARILELTDPLLETVLQAIPLDLARARRTAEIRARHYHRRSRPISLGDAILLASANVGDRIATADPDVLAVAKAEDLEPLPLPGGG